MGGAWYRLYSDGWLEQGQSTDDTGDAGMFGSKKITFPKAYRDKSYILVGPGFTMAPYGRCSVRKETTYFQTGTEASTCYSYYWTACGYAAAKRRREMSNVFDVLRGGVIGDVTENGKTYATAPTPPDGDSSTKVATTAFVKTATPSGNVAVWSRDIIQSGNNLLAPPGGSWFCWGRCKATSSGSPIWYDIAAFASGRSSIQGLQSGYSATTINVLGIKIA